MKLLFCSQFHSFRTILNLRKYAKGKLTGAEYGGSEVYLLYEIDRNCPVIFLFMFSRQFKLSDFRMTVATRTKMSSGWLFPTLPFAGCYRTAHRILDFRTTSRYYSTQEPNF